MQATNGIDKKRRFQGNEEPISLLVNNRDVNPKNPNQDHRP